MGAGLVSLVVVVWSAGQVCRGAEMAGSLVAVVWFVGPVCRGTVGSASLAGVV